MSAGSEVLLNAQGITKRFGGINALTDVTLQVSAGETVGLDFYPPPPSWLDLFVEKRQPRLPAALADVVKSLEKTPPRLLELPPEVARLARPF